MNYEDQGMVMKLPDQYSEQNNFIHRDAYNKINFTEWGEEDGDFELEEEFHQSNQIQVIQDNNSQQELSSGADQQDVEKTVSPDQIHLTQTNDEQVDEVTIDDDTHFPPRDNEMKSILEEIEKLEQSESVQVNEIPVQSVLIDRNDVSTLESEITKSQQSEKGRKKVSKKSTARRKSKADTDSVQPVENVENNLYSEDGNDSGDDNLKRENSEMSASITKSGRKIHKPIFFNPSSYIEPKKKLTDAKDPSSEPNKAPSDSKKSSSKRSL
ncbi:17203_t:CDS:2, partial [Racocetra persica]